MSKLLDCFYLQAEDSIHDALYCMEQTSALPISHSRASSALAGPPVGRDAPARQGADRPPPDLLAAAAARPRGGRGDPGLGLRARRHGARIALYERRTRAAASRLRLGDVGLDPWPRSMPHLGDRKSTRLNSSH